MRFVATVYNGETADLAYFETEHRGARLLCWERIALARSFNAKALTWPRWSAGRLAFGTTDDPTSNRLNALYIAEFHPGVSATIGEPRFITSRTALAKDLGGVGRLWGHHEWGGSHRLVLSAERPTGGFGIVDLIDGQPARWVTNRDDGSLIDPSSCDGPAMLAVRHAAPYSGYSDLERAAGQGQHIVDLIGGDLFDSADKPAFDPYASPAGTRKRVAFVRRHNPWAWSNDLIEDGQHRSVAGPTVEVTWTETRRLLWWTWQHTRTETVPAVYSVPQWSGPDTWITHHAAMKLTPPNHDDRGHRWTDTKAVEINADTGRVTELARIPGASILHPHPIPQGINP